MKSILLTAVSFFLLFTAPVSGTEIRQERVQFKPGETGATINDNDQRVIGLLTKGIGAGDVDPVVARRCTWLEAVP